MTDTSTLTPTNALEPVALPAGMPEPVAFLSVDCIDERYLCFTKPNDGDPLQALYTAAQVQAMLAAASQPLSAAVERKPLTREQVLALIEAEGNAPEHRTMYDFARAIERAHGIVGITAQQGGGT